MKRFFEFDIITVTLLIFIYQSSVGQISDLINDNKFRYTRFLGVARSSFDVNGLPSSPSYSSLELRLGAGILKPIGKYFELKSGLNLGLKVKRKSYFFGPSKQFTNEPWVMRSLDEAASSRNHFFVEIPLTLQYNLPNTRIRLKGGLNFRFWVPNNDSVDVLTGRPEIGMLGGVSYNLYKRISIGLEYYYGLTNILRGYYYINSSQLIEYNVRNQFIQVVIEQTF